MSYSIIQCHLDRHT